MNIAIVIILLLITFLLATYGPQIKGYWGEKTVSSKLQLLDKSAYHVLNNIVLETAGRTTQIDHLVISAYGLFVIETKNYKGWIMGGETSEYWTQVLYKRKEKFYNPIRQNYGHIMALRNHLREFPGINYISVIVFSAGASINVNSRTHVVYPHQLLTTIQKYSTNNLSEAERLQIVYKISLFNASKTYSKRKHIKAIQTRVRNREAIRTENKCPNCGSQLVARKGKFGNFIGCSAYPQCKFTRNA